MDDGREAYHCSPGTCNYNHDFGSGAPNGLNVSVRL